MISVKDLTFTYTGGDAPAINDLDFQIEPGEIFGFLGPSGAGKSTTQKILIGLLRDFKGQVSVFDRPLTDWGQDYYQRVGVSFELPNHYLKLSGNENLRYFGSLYEGSVHKPDELLGWVGLEDDGDMLVSQYSKGMKNRLNVARSLLHDPELLFLDEPTAGLDPVNARRIKELIREQKEAGKTVFLTTHDMSVADQLCDRVAFIIDGEIKLIDSPRSLKLEHGKQMVKVEFGVNGATEQQEFPLDGLAENNEFQGILRQNSIQTIHSQEATLEDIFIQVTGRSLA
ncbi:MAG: ABC transporter ATP-binding protein [Chloroflexi bacterium]|nr:MAG: ABC transporter ATP-binding protein [Chloroflexota bacterium]MBL1194675.1 ABC transporter ATP-binding protein [Chloroflexota bacterium]NOH11966.1 ABC transporter ATP-binding protein [Chloroflexota bacterium]